MKIAEKKEKSLLGKELALYNILIGKVSPEIFILHHPNLGMTYGFKIYL